jgi:hypothetical protein
MSPKAPPVFKRPGTTNADTEAKLAELAERAEARGNAVAGEVVAESSQAREVASPQARKLAKFRAVRDSASSVARSGTQAEPYVRARDGQATRSTTIHLPVELHQRLRMEAASREVHMSAIVAEAVSTWLKRR